MHSHHSSESLRANDHSGELLALGAALAENETGDVVRSAAALLVSAVAAALGQPFAGAVVNLGLHTVFGKWFSEVDDPELLRLPAASGQELFASTLGPYIDGGVNTARAVVVRPGPHPERRMRLLLRVWKSHYDAEREALIEFRKSVEPTLWFAEQY